MFVMVKSITFLAGVAESAQAETLALMARAGQHPSVYSAWIGAPLPHGLNDSDQTWRLRFHDEPAYHAWLGTEMVRQVLSRLRLDAGVHVDGATYNTGRAEILEPGITNGVWRLLMCSVAESASAAARAGFERDQVFVGQYVSTIRNWALSRVIQSEGRRRWTHIFEQEFRDISGFQGEYMAHPIHFGVVDRWYDVECPEHIVDPHLISSCFPIARSVMA